MENEASSKEYGHSSELASFFYLMKLSIGVSPF